jgi:poly(A) polymerase
MRGYTAEVMTDTQPPISERTPDRPRLHPEWIDSHASGIVKALQKAGHTSYLVGGCVRDLLLGIIPKDFDIVTMAHPPQVKRLIHMAFIIGKRFRLVLVKRGDQQFEVATFRREFNPTEFPVEDFPDGPPSADNIFGTPEQDAKRRDFTINALFYDPTSQELIDHVGGRQDIEKRTIRMIGEPDRRLAEDPIRILRALRFAHKLRFIIEPELRSSMARHSQELRKSVLPRRREELLKLLRLENPCEVLVECHDLGVLREIFPSIEKMFATIERQERFLARFDLFRNAVLDFSQTGQVFAWLAASIFDTLSEEGASPSEEELNVFMRDELGMYKFEQSLVIDALKLRRTIEKTVEHRRRGERRLVGIIRREGFDIALRLASTDLLLSGADLLFWRQAEERVRPDLEAAKRHREERPGGRRSRNRRRSSAAPASKIGEADEDSTSPPDDMAQGEPSDDEGDFSEVPRQTSQPESQSTESPSDSSSR